MRKIVLAAFAVTIGMSLPAAALTKPPSIIEPDMDADGAVDLGFFGHQLYMKVPEVIDFDPETVREAVDESRDEIAPDPILRVILDLRGVRQGLYASMRAVEEAVAGENVVVLTDSTTGEDGFELARSIETHNLHTVIEHSTFEACGVEGSACIVDRLGPALAPTIIAPAPVLKASAH